LADHNADQLDTELALRVPAKAATSQSTHALAVAGGPDHALFAVISVFLGAYILWVTGDAAGFWDASSRIPLLSQTLLLVFEISTVILALRAGSRANDTRISHAWRLFAIAQVASGIVSIAWIDRLGFNGGPEAGSVAVQCIGAAYNVLFLAALLRFPVRRLHSTERSTFWFDAAIVAGVAAILTWHLVLRTALIAAGSDWKTSIYALTYPVADIVILFATVALLLRRPLNGTIRSIRIMFIAALLNAAADVLYMWADIAEQATDTQFFYVAWVLVGWMAAAAAISQGRRVILRLRSHTAGTDDRHGQAPSLIPYVAMIAIYATLLFEISRTESASIAQAIQLGKRTLPIAQYPMTALVVGTIVVTAIVIVRQVASQRRNAELAVEQLAREAHFRALVQHSSDMVLVLDASGIIREASPAVAHVLGYSPESVVNQLFCSFFVAEDRAAVQADIAQAVAAGNGDTAAGGPVEWRVRDANGGERWIEAICTNLLADPVVHGIVVNGRDVSERKQLEVELTHRAYHDPLTGLVNAARFRTKIADAIVHATSGSRTGDGRGGLAVLYIDLDGFKEVNDALGHDAGDVVLATIADRLRDATRGSDTAARLGGDEFAILLERLRDTDEVRMVAERVLHLVRRPVAIGDREASVNASIGIACTTLGSITSPEQITIDSETLLRQADSAMYAAKARGHGQYEFYSTLSNRVA
jgi:diguanylate cyclase (GGDEF)-like protein/PAS domain S-box-containing protein